MNSGGLALKHFAGTALVLVLTGCGVVARPLTDAATQATVEARVSATLAVTGSTPTPVESDGSLAAIADLVPVLEATATGCAPGEEPSFAEGFADLKALLGERMGQPLTCERHGPDGDSLQQTTTGLARYTHATNIASFTRGREHWAITEAGLVHWVGGGFDPPPDAELASLAVPTAPPTPGLPTPPGPPLLTEATATLAPQPPLPGPRWLDRPVELLRDYDRRFGTVLVTALQRTRIVVAHLPGAWASFIPRTRTITLDPILAGESPEAVATVLAHEALHASDFFLYGFRASEAACYSYEISAFSLQARVWAHLHGPAGLANPRTELEGELNEILQLARTRAGELLVGIKDRYQDQCEA